MLTKDILYEHLVVTDNRPVVCGWTAKDIQAKLERFMAKDIDRMLQVLALRKRNLSIGVPVL
jgi:hypothetical protein